MLLIYGQKKGYTLQKCVAIGSTMLFLNENKLYWRLINAWKLTLPFVPQMRTAYLPTKENENSTKD